MLVPVCRQRPLRQRGMRYKHCLVHALPPNGGVRCQGVALGGPSSWCIFYCRLSEPLLSWGADVLTQPRWCSTDECKVYSSLEESIWLELVINHLSLNADLPGPGTLVSSSLLAGLKFGRCCLYLNIRRVSW